jgi:hypothetical protein
LTQGIEGFSLQYASFATELCGIVRATTDYVRTMRQVLLSLLKHLKACLDFFFGVLLMARQYDSTQPRKWHSREETRQEKCDLTENNETKLKILSLSFFDTLFSTFPRDLRAFNIEHNPIDCYDSHQ